MYDLQEANAWWRNQLEDFQKSDAVREGAGIDGEPIELEWNIFPGLTTLDSAKDPKKSESSTLKPQQLEGRFHFMSIFNDTDWTKKRISVDLNSEDASLRINVTEMLINCQMWITLSQTQVLLDVKRSFFFF